MLKRFFIWTLALALAFAPVLASAQSPQVRATVLFKQQPAPAAAGGPTTLFGPHAYSGTNFSPGNNGWTRRSPFGLLSGSGPLLQIRVTVHGGFSTGTVIDHMAMGIANGTWNDTTAIPIEITFSGGHGVTLTAGQTVASDWMGFPSFTSSNILVAIEDFNAAALNADSDCPTQDALGANIFTVGSVGASYNVATFGSGTNQDLCLWTITKIEVQ